jgi:hypothetical protein
MFVYDYPIAGSDLEKDTEHMSCLEYTDKPSALDKGEVWVEYHPASGKCPEILRAEQMSRPSVTLPTVPFDEQVSPWHPFRSRADFEQAELFLRGDCTDSFIDAQLKLIHAGSPLGHSITLQSAKEMHQILTQIPTIEDLPDVRVSQVFCGAQY